MKGVYVFCFEELREILSREGDLCALDYLNDFLAQTNSPPAYWARWGDNKYKWEMVSKKKCADILIDFVSKNNWEVPLWDLWRQWDKRRRYLGVCFDPSNNHDNCEVLNLFNGFKIDPCSDHISDEELMAEVGEWEWFVKNVVCYGEEEACDFLLNHLASIFQHPGKRSDIVVVLESTKDIRTDCIFAPLHKILGDDLFPPITDAILATKHFRPQIVQSLVVLFDEFINQYTPNYENHVKVVLQNINSSLDNKQYIYSKYQPSYCNYFIVGSESFFTELEKIDDPRFFMISMDKYSKFSKLGTQYFEKIKNTRPDYLLKYLLRRKNK